MHLQPSTRRVPGLWQTERCSGKLGVFAPLLMGRSFLGRSLACLVLLGSALPLATEAQPSLRSSFPGRRIGGGTRGECSARFLANLVPSSSVYAPGSSNLIGLLEGPAGTPHPLLLSFSSYSLDPATAASGSAPSERLLPASAAGLVLLTLPPLKGPTRWESAYRCPDGGSGSGGTDLDFVQSASPPALSLLVPQSEPSDQQVQAQLKRFSTFCGKTLPLFEVAKAFNLTDALGPGWPSSLPVRCL